MNNCPPILPCWFQLSITVQNDSINADQWYCEDGDDIQQMMEEVKVYLSNTLKACTSLGNFSFRLVRNDRPEVIDFLEKLNAKREQPPSITY